MFSFFKNLKNKILLIKNFFISTTMKEKTESWLEKSKSGKKTSIFLWIFTFAFSLIISLSFVGVNFYLSLAEKSLLDSEIIKSWTEFIEIWIYGLIWFSGFIATGTIAKNVAEKIENSKKQANDFLDELKEKKSNEQSDDQNQGIVL